MDAPGPAPEEEHAAVAKDGDSVADLPAAEAPSATKAAVERGRDDERSRWGLLLIAAVVLLVLVVAWKGRAILAVFGGPR
jgi:hypothetical protein